MTSQSVHDSRYSWFRLVITMLLGFVANVGIWAIIVIMPAVEAEFGATRADASLPYTLVMIGFAVGNYLIGKVLDKVGVTQALILAAIAIAVGFCLSVISPTITVLAAAHFVLGLGAAVGFGPLIADISHWFMRRRGIAVALVASSNYLSGAIWPLALSGLLASYGWKSVYLVLAAITLAALIPLSLLLRRQVPEEETKRAATAALVNSRNTGLSPRMLQYILGFAGIACCVAMSMPQVHIVSYCVGLGYGPAVGAEMLSLMLMGGVVSRVLSGLVADKIGGILTLLIGSVLQGLALFLFIPFDGMAPLYLISMLFGLSQGGIVPSYALVVREYMPPKEAGSRVGFVLMMTILGMALGGWMSGWIFDLSGSYQMAFVNGIIWNGLNIAIVVTLMLRSGPLRQSRSVA